MSTSEQFSAGTMTSEIRHHTGVNIARCYQCGKCSAGCPMAEETRLRPHDVLRLAQLDQRERVLADESLWLCLTCETCTARCPNDCDPARVIDSLRELGLREGLAKPPRRIRAFHAAFLKQIWRSGRIFEMGLVTSYKMRSGALFADVLSVPGLMGRGKLALAPTRIKGVADVRRIFDACSGPSGGDDIKADTSGAHEEDAEPAEKEGAETQ